MAGPPAYLIVYDILSFTSALVFLITILTVVASKRLYRCKNWFNMMSCWLVFALSYGLLVGKQTGSEPSTGQCYFQALLTYAAPPLVAAGTLSFYTSFYIHSCWDLTRRRTLRPGVAWLILVFPWILHLAIDIEVVVISILSKASPLAEKNQNNLYCRLNDNSLPGVVTAVVVTLLMVLLIPLEVWTGIQLFRSKMIHNAVEFRQYLCVYFRIAVCTTIAVAILVLSATKLANQKSGNIIQDFSFPCLSMMAALIFATQEDLLCVWLCRKPHLSNLDGSQSIARSLPQVPKAYGSSRTLHLEVSGHPLPLQYA